MAGNVTESLTVDGGRIRVRRTGVFEFQTDHGDFTIFKSVRSMREKYQDMLKDATEQLQIKNDTCFNDIGDYLSPPDTNSNYSTPGTSDDERSQRQDSSPRRRSSDSSEIDRTEEDEARQEFGNWLSKTSETTGSLDYTGVPSRTIIKANYVPYPADRKFSDTSELGDCTKFECRRDSHCTDEGDGEVPKCRYWRTPSVVVSDYSDDVVGLSLDDIEYFRSYRNNYSSPESSLNSSCSNLNYCGSSISCLESEVQRYPLRKQSVCSTCSNLSGDEEADEVLPEICCPKKPSGWRKLRTIVQWTPFFQTYKKQRYPWVQLAGHQGNFKAGPDQGTILKKFCEKEEKCFKMLMKDVLRPYVPEYKGIVTSDECESSYIQQQDLLSDFRSPCVMDCKIGVRTYLEEELAKAKEKPKLRKDMYEKMCQIDSGAPTEEEHRLKGVTKPRYMIWRETISSTETLGFRIEGIRRSDGTSSKDFKTTKSRESVTEAFVSFTEGFPHSIPKYIQRLKAIRATLEASNFFESHEVIGSSLLFVHDQTNANVWLIDFAKTVKLPDNMGVDHKSKWKVGNHEDGYLIGVNNIISIFNDIIERNSAQALQDHQEQQQSQND